VKLLGEWKIPIGWGLKLLKINIPLNLMRDPTTKTLLSDFENDELFHGKQKKKWKPTVPQLLGEIERRMKFLKITKKMNKQKKKTEFLEWLQDNVGYLPDDRAFLMQKILWFRETLENTRQDDPATHMQYRGMDWILRLIHCLTDDDNARYAYARVTRLPVGCVFC